MGVTLKNKLNGKELSFKPRCTGDGDLQGLFNKCTSTVPKMPPFGPKRISLQEERSRCLSRAAFASFPACKPQSFAPRLSAIKQSHKHFSLITIGPEGVFSFYQANKISALRGERQQVSGAALNLATVGGAAQWH